MTLVTILILAITVEALIEYGKLIFQKQINWKQLVALVLGVLLAVAANVDLYVLVGVTFIIPYVGVVLTGIIFSRGANYVADFLKMIQGIKRGQQNPPSAADKIIQHELSEVQRQELLNKPWALGSDRESESSGEDEVAGDDEKDGESDE